MKNIFLFPHASADRGPMKYGDQVYDILAYYIWYHHTCESYCELRII